MAEVFCIFWIKKKEQMLEEKLSWKPIFFPWKQQHGAGSLNLLCHLEVGVCLTDKLWLQGSTSIYMDSLCDISDVSLTHDIPFKYLRGTTQWKNVEENSNASKYWTELFQELKEHPLMIAGSTCWGKYHHCDLPNATSTFVLPPKTIPKNIF